MSKNLLKSYYTTKESSTPRIINGNVAVEQAIERVSAERAESLFNDGFESLQADVYEDLTADFTTGLDADIVSGLLDDTAVGEGETAAFSTNVIKAEAEFEPVSQQDVTEEVDAIKHRLLEEALEEIANMKDQAAEDIAREKAQAIEEARAQGYEEGARQAYEEFEQSRRELEMEKRQHEEEYAEMIFDLEPKFVRYLTNIYEKVFQVDLAEEKEIVVNLLKNAMQKVEISKNYMIHVSKDDYKFVYEHKKELSEATMSEDAVIDVVEDATLKAGDCFVETANGIFDCGIETQLTALKKKLMLLAYDGR